MRLKSLLRSVMVIITVAAAAITVPAGAAWAVTQGPYQIKPLANMNLCAQPQGESLADLTVIELVGCRNVGAQKWYFRDSQAWGYPDKLIVNGASHTCMNVRNAGGVGTPLVLYGCSDNLSSRRNDIFKPELWFPGPPDFYFLEEGVYGNCISSGASVAGTDLKTAPYSDPGNRCEFTWISVPR
ncbi:RICIN domain-containing protein [Actinoplanes sp. URMC 104]|uniref:RICIN domain-containing protein n=1 Tax=Actinoplanes sp. URMC 104 TaxID=3423409 RepID=UPI003F1AD0A1